MHTNIPPNPSTYNLRALDLVWGRFHQERFAEAAKIANIRIDLNLSSIPKDAQTETVQKIMRKYRNAASRFLYGKKAKRGTATANLVVHHHKRPQHHVHILLEIPEEFLFREVRDFTNEFILKNRERFIPRDGTLCFLEETETVTGSAIYNAKYGQDTLILF